MRPELQYIADTIFVESFLREDYMKIAIAQDNSIGSTILSGLKSYISSVFDKNRPISSIASLFTNSLLWSLKSKKLAILYTLAGALGFDWKAFWSSLGASITDFVKEIISSRKPADANTTHSKVSEMVSNAVSSSFSGDVDKEKLNEMNQQGILQSLNTVNNKNLIKTADMKSKLAGVLIKIVGWLIVTVLGMIGLSELGKVLSDKDSKKSEESTEQAQGIGKLIKISPDAPQDLFSLHRNNMSSIWIEHGEIENVDSILLEWVFSAYPQLEQYESQLKNSSGFDSMVQKFKDRNKLAGGLNMISVPRPYQRKIDIVSAIVGPFIRGFSSQYHSIPASSTDQNKPRGMNI
jgi:hypothetical protein